uniref:FHA domain-containing protein n=1 Tax=Romanomermis culicivorax TaxID=13658 RepID=A0A915IZW6_ROMCU
MKCAFFIGIPPKNSDSYLVSMISGYHCLIQYTDERNPSVFLKGLTLKFPASTIACFAAGDRQIPVQPVSRRDDSRFLGLNEGYLTCFPRPETCNLLPYWKLIYPFLHIMYQCDIWFSDKMNIIFVPNAFSKTKYVILWQDDPSTCANQLMCIDSPPIGFTVQLSYWTLDWKSGLTSVWKSTYTKGPFH